MSDNNNVIDTTGESVEEEEDTQELGDVIQDVEIQKRRLKTLADRFEAGPVEREAEDGTKYMEPPTPVTAVSVLRELASNVLPVIGDMLKFMDRLEENAEWTGDKLEQLLGDQEGDSQLNGEDSDRLKDFLNKTVEDCNARLADADPESEKSKELSAHREEGIALAALIDELRLEETRAGGEEAPPQAEA
jgi:hypothetical protein